MKNLPPLPVTIMLLIYIIGFTISSCGPSKEEMEAREKEKADSIAQIESQQQTVHADSIREYHRSIGLAVGAPTSDEYQNATEIEYNGHIYVYFENPRGMTEARWGCHSATCTNPIHNRQYNGD